MTREIKEFLKQSNYIEREYSIQAYNDAKKAWDFAYDYKDTINLDYILSIHRILMKKLNPRIAGELRNCDVLIGGVRKYFISEQVLKNQIAECLEDMKIKHTAGHDIEKDCKEHHVRFEYIHPFEDGNGCVGRILYNIHRLKLGLPIHIIHEGEEQMKYYEWFK